MKTAAVHEGVRRMRFESLLARQGRGAITQDDAGLALGISVRTLQRIRPAIVPAPIGTACVHIRHCGHILDCHDSNPAETRGGYSRQQGGARRRETKNFRPGNLHLVRANKNPALEPSAGFFDRRRDMSIDSLTVLCRPGSDLLSQVLRLSTIGAGAFHGRVRNGIGCSNPAITTRSAEHSETSGLISVHSRSRHTMSYVSPRHEHC